MGTKSIVLHIKFEKPKVLMLSLGYLKFQIWTVFVYLRENCEEKLSELNLGVYKWFCFVRRVKMFYVKHWMLFYKNHKNILWKIRCCIAKTLKMFCGNIQCCFVRRVKMFYVKHWMLFCRNHKNILWEYSMLFCKKSENVLCETLDAVL